MKLSFTASFISLLGLFADAQTGYEIPVTIRPLKNQKVYLGTYLGKSTILVDSAALNNESAGAFKGTKKLIPGVYLLVSTSRTVLFDFLVGDDQQFSVSYDTSMPGNTVYKGSADNEINQVYSKFMSSKLKEKKIWEDKHHLAKTKADTLEYTSAIRAINNEETDYQSGIAKKYPASLVAFLIHAMKRPVIPELPIVNGKPDSLFAYRYVKDHYWDDIMFNDDRLLRTPFFEPKLDEYFTYYVTPQADSVIAEVKHMLLFARTAKELYPYLLIKFTNKYMNPEYMGLDKVFVYLFENFYATGDTLLLNPESKKIITERAYNLMANQIGLPAPPLNLTDTSGKIISLYTIAAPYTIVVWWDPECSHCKEEIPKLDSVYRAKWKQLGVGMYSINADEAHIPQWKRFMKEKNLSPEWQQVYETTDARKSGEKNGQPNYRQLYDFHVTPTIYLLDKDKHILAKKLTLEQFDEIIKVNSKKVSR
ncbi:MAG: redoxin domain-containing protein [Bacteroidota bacterium]